MSCSRVAMSATAYAFALTAASMTGGASTYSLNRSAQVFSTSECTSTSFPETSPAFLNSAGVPLPTSTTGTCFAVNAGPIPTDTARTLNSTGGIVDNFGSVAVPIDDTVTTVSPSAQECGILNSSVCTLSAPASLNDATPQATARSMAGAPGTRPPISSVR